MGGRGGGGVGKIVKYGGMSNDRSSDKKSHKVRFEQALFKQIGPQLLYGLPVLRTDFGQISLFPGDETAMVHARELEGVQKAHKRSSNRI